MTELKYVLVSDNKKASGIFLGISACIRDMKMYRKPKIPLVFPLLLFYPAVVNLEKLPRCDGMVQYIAL